MPQETYVTGWYRDSPRHCWLWGLAGIDFARGGIDLYQGYEPALGGRLVRVRS